MRSALAPRVDLSSSTTLAHFVPAEGGRIESIVDRHSGRNLLAVYGPGGRRGDWYTDAPGGWDEMFPNDAPWNSEPAHGRVWSAAFDIDAREVDRLVLVADLEVPPVSLRREYRVLDSPHRGLRVDTDLIARGPTGPFLWSSHPMLAVEPGWSVRIEPTLVEVDAEMAGRFTSAAGGRADARGLVVPARNLGWGEVLYVPDAESASVGTPGGETGTRVSWDRDFFAHLWVVTVTGYDGFDLGFLFEPSTTQPYRMDEAIARGCARSLGQGERVSFWAQIESLDAPRPGDGSEPWRSLEGAAKTG